MFKLLNATLANFAIAVVAAGAATAEPTAAGVTTTATVRFADLDLGQPAGVAVLRYRVEVAAVRVCGGQPDWRSIVQVQAFNECRKPALAQAMNQVDLAVAGRQPVLQAAR